MSIKECIEAGKYKDLCIINTGINGYTGRVTINHKKYLFKFSKRIDYSTEYESMILDDMSNMKYTSHYMEYIGTYKLRVQFPYDHYEYQDLMKKCSNYDPFKINRDFPLEWIKYTEVIFIKFIDRAKTLNWYLRSNDTTPEQIVSIAIQVAFALFLGECNKKFVHNDLNTNNILIVNCNKDTVRYYTIGDIQFMLPLAGVHVYIIDYGESRTDVSSSSNIMYNVSLLRFGVICPIYFPMMDWDRYFMFMEDILRVRLKLLHEAKTNVTLITPIQDIDSLHSNIRNTNSLLVDVMYIRSSLFDLSQKDVYHFVDIDREDFLNVSLGLTANTIDDEGSDISTLKRDISVIVCNDDVIQKCILKLNRETQAQVDDDDNYIENICINDMQSFRDICHIMIALKSIDDTSMLLEYEHEDDNDTVTSTCSINMFDSDSDNEQENTDCSLPIERNIYNYLQIVIALERLTQSIDTVKFILKDIVLAILELSIDSEDITDTIMTIINTRTSDNMELSDFEEVIGTNLGCFAGNCVAFADYVYSMFIKEVQYRVHALDQCHVKYMKETEPEQCIRLILGQFDKYIKYDTSSDKLLHIVDGDRLVAHRVILPKSTDMYSSLNIHKVMSMWT